MKRILFPILLLLLGALIVCASYVGYFILWPQKPASTPVASTLDVAPPLRSLVDVDALAARMQLRQVVYQKLRDEAFDAYAKRHPGQHPYDELAKTTLRLASYLWVWDDYYGEGLRRDLDNYAAHLNRNGCPDQIWASLLDIDFFRDRHSGTDDSVNIVNHCADLLAATEYPAAFKFESYANCVANMVKTKKEVSPQLKLQDLSSTIDKTIQSYRELVKQNLPNDILFYKGESLLVDVKDDEAS
jgi:hypothetical protein